jgi:ABC-type methionine transport system permease subunit
MPQEYSFVKRAAHVNRNPARHTMPFVRTERSALRPVSLFIISILLLVAGTSAVSAAAVNTVAVTDPLDAAALVYISGYEITPDVFYSGETGTVTIHVTNAANTTVFVSQPNLIESHVKVLNGDSFSTATAIGPGETSDYNFVIVPSGTDGTYFPLFTVSTNVYGAGAIHSQIKLKIDSTDIRASIAVKPDTFSASTKDRVNVSIVNPRDGDITNVLIVPEVDGATISPEESFIGTLKAGTSVQVPFAITPSKETAVTFHVTFNNGDNKHATALVLPLTLGDNKGGAEIVVNNVESSSSGTTLTLKGDVTNNGLTDARSVLVTVESPAMPINPNPVYAIGNLEPDDFSSFEVTYTMTGTGKVPVVVEYKDEDGNVFTERFSISTSGNTAASGSGSAQSGAVQSGGPGDSRGMMGLGSGFNQLPVTQIAIILVVIIVLLVAWRKGLLKPLTDRFRKKPEKDDDPEEQ